MPYDYQELVCGMCDATWDPHWKECQRCHGEKRFMMTRKATKAPRFVHRYALVTPYK